MSEANVKKWSAELCFHKRNSWIALRFQKDRALINRLKKRFPKSVWSQSLRAWLIHDTTENRQLFSLSEKLNYYDQINGTSIHPRLLSVRNFEALEQYHKELLLKSYSTSTINSYVGEFVRLLEILKIKSVQSLTSEQ